MSTVDTIEIGRRGLLEDLAAALGCAVADLTGQPYLPVDRESAYAKRVVTQIEHGLNEATLQDVPDVPARPLAELAEWIGVSAELRDTAQYRRSGEGIDAALIELQVHAVARNGRERLRAAELLTLTAYHAFVLATTFGYLHLAQLAAGARSTPPGSPSRPSWRRSRCSPVRPRWRVPAGEAVPCACSTTRSTTRSPAS